MKKFLCLFMTIVVFATISSFSMITFAKQSGELIYNGTFSNNAEGWLSQTGAFFERVKLGNEYVLKVSGRTEGYSSPYQDVLPDIKQCGWGKYDISARVKLIDFSGEEVFLYVIKCMFGNDEANTQYFTGEIMANDEFQTISATVDVQPKNENLKLTNAIVYFQTNTGYDYYVDDISLRKTDERTYPAVAVPIANRPEKTYVGAIRWDAWHNPAAPYQDASNPNDNRTIGQQMVDSLSPSKYHYRLPFFAKILDSNSITFPDYTQEIFDQEMRYAKEAGIDYFVYCWYDDIMSTARKLHTTSKYRNDVKMSGIWNHQVFGFEGSALDMWIDYLRQEFWLKIDNRPLIYVNNANQATEDQITNFRKACIEAGVGNPYIIGVEQFGCTTNDVKRIGYDAITNYTVGLAEGEPYSQLVYEARNLWNTWKNAGVDVVPIVSTGWDRRPRYDHPVSWENKGNPEYTQQGTAQQIANHLQDAIQFNNNYKSSTSANTVLMYAWNEHDEGGWLCPTIRVDSNGLAKTNADGSYQRDFSRLEAIQKVLKGQNAVWTIDDVNIHYEFEGATLDIGTTLSINYFAKADADYKAQITMNGKTQVVDAEYDSKKGLYKFVFTGINPQCMNDIVDAKLLDANGNEIDSYNNYSVRQYCNNMASTTAKENGFTEIQHKAMLTLLADTLNYGAQAQLYKEYKSDNLANNEPWVKEYESSFKVPQGIKKISGNQDPSDYISAAGLSISNVNNVYFRLVLNSDNVTITLNGKQCTKDQLTKDNNGTYILKSEDLTATQFDKVFNLVLLKNGQEISSIRYNVKAFIQSKHASATVGGISKALNNYGDSAVYYLKALNNDLDLDFDIGDSGFLTDNVIPDFSSTFDYNLPIEDSGWFVPDYLMWTTDMRFVDDGNGGHALEFDIGETYESVVFILNPYLKEGTYTISFKYKTIDTQQAVATIRSSKDYYIPLKKFNHVLNTVQSDEWHEFSKTVTFTKDEIEQSELMFCFDAIQGTGCIRIDDFQVIKN